ncbi:MAG: hypothetical protein AVDCRST_MAG67-788 [uncultured Solirubrobacteraceae bacterium]|uniref:Uncharacterized protein n=1 Tax=uncultured Solirubrobacteraceae bacterium TaxID=1162706 RepID=A0A6J4RSH1_9ACTN|nr:MAG: hypothetical protein AVDCRST_MAG67-788 [uncultured Solirubrobacteraceae bacterium]
MIWSNDAVELVILASEPQLTLSVRADLERDRSLEHVEHVDMLEVPAGRPAAVRSRSGRVSDATPGSSRGLVAQAGDLAAPNPYSRAEHNQGEPADEEHIEWCHRAAIARATCSRNEPTG